VGIYENDDNEKLVVRLKSNCQLLRTKPVNVLLIWFTTLLQLEMLDRRMIFESNILPCEWKRICWEIGRGLFQIYSQAFASNEWPKWGI